MQLIKDNIFHIYNQGNNRQKIFFNRENYLFFLQKMNDYILPYCDVMAWCLMPNHFHWMVYVREVELEFTNEPIDQVTLSKLNLNGATSRGATQSRTPNSSNLNQAIGIILSSYTRAINLQEKSSGSLFRQKTKADCVTSPQEISPSFYNLGFGSTIRLFEPEKEYPQVCFNYIHQNPVKSGLVKCPEDWEFSSYRDICGLRNGKLVCRKRVEEFGLKCELTRGTT